MRQTLDPDEIAALSPAERAYFERWMLDHGYGDVQHPTIGQLAEFLVAHRDSFQIEYTSDHHLRVKTGWDAYRGWHDTRSSDELILSLWTGVRAWLAEQGRQP